MSPCYHLLAPISTYVVVQGLAQLLHKHEVVGSNTSIGTIHSFPFHFPTHFPVFLVVCLSYAHTHTHTCTYTHATTTTINTNWYMHMHMHTLTLYTNTTTTQCIQVQCLHSRTHTNTQTQMCMCTCTTITTITTITQCKLKCVTRVVCGEYVCKCASWHMKNTTSASCSGSRPSRQVGAGCSKQFQLAQGHGCTQDIALV